MAAHELNELLTFEKSLKIKATAREFYQHKIDFRHIKKEAEFFEKVVLFDPKKSEKTPQKDYIVLNQNNRNFEAENARRDHLLKSSLVDISRKLFEQNYERSHLTTKAITFGSKRNQSLHINLESGLFKDFKTGVGGNIYGLIYYGVNDANLEKNNKEGFKQSLDWAKNYLGNLDPAYKYEHQKNSQTFSNNGQKIETKSQIIVPHFDAQKSKNDHLKCIIPIHKNVTTHTLKNEKTLTYVLKFKSKRDLSLHQ